MSSDVDTKRMICYAREKNPCSLQMRYADIYFVSAYIV